MDQVSARVFIVGRVHGVGFRYYTKQEAEALMLKGWVRNVLNSEFGDQNSGLATVEAVFEGGKGDVEEMIEWCKSGSPTAQVSRVEVKWGPARQASLRRQAQGEEAEGLKGFEIKETV